MVLFCLYKDGVIQTGGTSVAIIPEKMKKDPSPDSAEVLGCSFCRRGVEEGGHRCWCFQLALQCGAATMNTAGLTLCATDAIQTRIECGLASAF